MMRATALVAGALLLLTACGGGDAPGSAELDPAPPVDEPTRSIGGNEGDTLPAVEMVDLSTGETVRLDEIGGPAVVNLWATWCAPCRAEIPDFEEVHQARSDEVRFVGINIAEDPDRAAGFIDEVGASYEQFVDENGEVSAELRATSMPVTVVIDADGVVTTRHLGPLDQDGLNEAIDEALAASN